MNRLRWPSTLFICALFMQAANATPATDRLIVKFKPGFNNGMMHTKRADTVRQASGAAMVPLRELSNGAQLYRLPSAVDIATAEQLSRQIAADPNVAYAEPDRIHKRALTPNDPYYPSQWQLFDSFGARLTSAWDVTTGSASIVIALIDTGYVPHADLAGRFLPGYDFISDPFIANDGDGRDADARDPGDWVTQADVNARPTVCGPSDIGDSSWHGLLVAGIAGATGNNAIGVAGMNWGARLLPVRTLGKCGGFTSDIVEGMRWAAGLSVPGVPTNPTPAHIINISLGSTGACSQLEQEAIDAIVSAGKVVVAAAGNDATDAASHSPSNCDYVISVAATTRSGSRASYSNFGADVTISAPVGENTFEGTSTTWNTGMTSPGVDMYAVGIGTSFAAPYVSGIVGLMLSVSPNLNPDQVAAILMSTAQPFPSSSTCTNQICGAGIIDANAAVRTAALTVGAAPVQVGGGTASPAPTTGGGGSSGGGGGGCTTHPGTTIDPTLLALATFALLALGRRRAHKPIPVN